VKALFVTGTDTGCGKTSVGVALALAARAAGLAVRVLKPVETGCEAGVPADALALARAAGDARPVDEICPVRLALPAAPLVAARAEGVEIELASLVSAYERTSSRADLVLVEGAGGLRVPIAPGVEMGDLARALDTPLLVVARAALGTINHTLLTLQAAAAQNLPVAGVVISHTQPGLSRADRANLDQLLAALPAPFWGELAHGAVELEPPLDLLAQLGIAADS
jgi:dethiobiotin synthetase